jgi:protein-tyrosine phosphatase
MIDIHSHLIFDVDDGSRSIEESLNIIKMMYEAGVRDMIITPHYITDSKYVSKKKDNNKKLTILKKELKNNNIDMNLYLGNEIYIDRNIDKLIEDKEVSTLNNSKYILVELPMSGHFNGYQDVLHDLKCRGYKVILAHPERYISFQKDFKKILELKELGILFQSNYGSILGDYGLGSKLCIKKMMKNNLIDFFSSDIHRLRHSDFIERAKKVMRKYYTESEIDNLVCNNAYEIIK